MVQLLEAALVVLAILVLALAAWPRLLSHLVRRRVERIERPVRYDPVLGICADGQPVLLHDPSYDTTVVFFDGFRIRPAASMHREGLERLHREQRVNVLAPVLGHQSMPFRLRNRDWNHQEECRAAAQLVQAYKAAQGPDHQVVVVGFSWGAIHCYTLAALGLCDSIVLISPLPHRLDIQARRVIRSNGIAAKSLRWLLTAIFSGRGYGLLGRVLPYYMRPGVSGGWDIADPELRARYNRDLLNGQELRIFDVYEIVAAVGHVHAELLPRITGTDVTVVWGRRDSMIVEPVFEDLVRAFAVLGNRTYPVPVAESAHNVLHDAGAATAWRAVADAVVRRRETAVGAGGAAVATSG